MRDEMKTCLRPEEVNHLRNQFEPVFVGQIVEADRV